ncbi:MAG: hypothetical protein ACD_62C00350G0012 [uncultured bacterium]|nr:MAG: hypothetical protein ACD_62C00350G0012 [uncultured bacterium]
MIENRDPSIRWDDILYLGNLSYFPLIFDIQNMSIRSMAILQHVDILSKKKGPRINSDLTQCPLIK